MAEPYAKLVQLVEAFDRDRRSPDVLFLGDSVVERVSRNDRDVRTLGEMVVDEFAPSIDGLAVSHSGFHPAVFREIATLRHVELDRPPDAPLATHGAAQAARERGVNRLAERLEAWPVR